MEYKPQGKRLGSYEIDALILLAEECSEVQQAASKCLRFGLDDYRPNVPIPTNRQWLASEIGNVLAMVRVIINAGLIDEHDIRAGLKNKIEKLPHFSDLPKEWLLPSLTEQQHAEQAREMERLHGLLANEALVRADRGITIDILKREIERLTAVVEQAERKTNGKRN